MPETKKGVGIKVKLKSRVYYFCPSSEILETNLIFCISEPEFDDQSAVCIFKSKKPKRPLPEGIRKKLKHLFKVEKLRVFRDKKKNKRLILNLTY